MIYVLKENQNLKVGYSSNLDKRLKQYKTHNNNFSLLMITEGDRILEKEIHLKLKDYKIRTEWFNYCTETIEILRNYSFEEFIELTKLEHNLINILKPYGRLHIIKSEKQVWANKLNITLNQINNIIYTLVSKKILIKESRTIYNIHLENIYIN